MFGRGVCFQPAPYFFVGRRQGSEFPISETTSLSSEPVGRFFLYLVPHDRRVLPVIRQGEPGGVKRRQIRNSGALEVKFTACVLSRSAWPSWSLL